MEKWLCWSSMGVAGLVLLLFTLDLVFGLIGLPFKPFGGISYVVDVVLILAAGVVLYLSYNAVKDIL